MARPKKGQLAQFQVPMVDSTDFASIESGITASDFNSGATVKFYGLNHGGSAATTSGTVSKTASLVRSGIFRITLKGTENNYDGMTLRVNKTGCAEQIIQWDNVDNDDSDLMSQILLATSAASDAASAAQQANSRILLVQSRLSDFDSRLVSDISDLRSQLSDAHSDLLSILLGLSDNLSDAHSDLRSYLVGLSGSLSDVQSALSDAHSDLASKIGGVAVTISASDVSDIASAVIAGLPVASQISDIYSLLSDLNSNILSRIPAEPASRSQLSALASDVISAVLIVQSMASDAASAAQQGNSRLLVNQSRLSDMASVLSDLDSTISATNANFTSDISDIASAVRATLASDLSDILSAAQQTNSRVLLNQSRISDIYSQLSDFRSDIHSHVSTTGVGLNASTMSDIRSAINALTVSLDASNISDIASAVVEAIGDGLGSDVASKVVAGLSDNFSNVQSNVNRAYSLLSDLNSQFLSRIPKEPAARSQLSDMDSNLLSYLAGMSGTLSDVHSGLAVVQSMASDAASAAQQGASRALINQSRISDVASVLSNVESMVTQSPVLVRTTIATLAGQTEFTLTAGATDDDAYTGCEIIIEDQATAAQKTVCRVSTYVGATRTAFIGPSPTFTIAAGDKVTIVASTHVHASVRGDFLDITAGNVGINWGNVVNATAAVALTNTTIGLNASAISDVRSAVTALVGSDISDILSAVRGNSDTLSDVHALLSDLDSNFQSRVPKAVATNSQLSSLWSDLNSQLSDVQSDLKSAITNAGVSTSAISDIASAVWAYTLTAPTAAIGATPTTGEAAAWLATMSRNKLTQTSTKQIMYADNGTTVVASAVCSDDGTVATRGEFG